MSLSEPWRELWAKTERGGERWHALPFHLLDVAATAERLWDALPGSAKRVPLDLDPSEQDCRKFVTFLAAAHDVRKANPYFQYKDGRRAATLGTQNPGPEQEGRGYATGAFLKEWLTDRWQWNIPAAANVARAWG